MPKTPSFDLLLMRGQSGESEGHDGINAFKRRARDRAVYGDKPPLACAATIWTTAEGIPLALASWLLGISPKRQVASGRDQINLGALSEKLGP